ncbi:MAG: TonB-dependent receptor plug domain-containing protein [Bacteroidales bacterium]|nr:TonB-dependent receptor plug domain-containing protein [Bacteroidales bacterium]
MGNFLDYGKHATADIEGFLVDGKTGEPVSGAVINDANSNINVITDKNGKFSLTLPVGEHELAVKFFGYEESRTKIKIFGKGTLKLEIFEKSVNLDEVIVRAQMDQHNSMRNQMSMVRIDAKGIKELPVSMGETDIIKSVTLMPGVQSAGEFGTGFNVRGGSADQNLVLIEDLPVFNPSHVFGLISIINPDDVANITLLKAGIPARYGEKASSVLDIKMGTSQPEKLTAKGGIGIINSRLCIKTPLWKNKLSLKLSGRSSYSDWLLHQLPDADLQKSNAGFYDLNGMLVFTPNPFNRISLFAYNSFDNFIFSNTTQYKYANKIGRDENGSMFLEIHFHPQRCLERAFITLK